MATTPYFIVSPTAILSILGMIHGPDKTIPTPKDDWRTAVVEVAIPLYNEESKIALCLASLATQTIKPRQIVLINDGSKDNSASYAREFAKSIHLPIEIISRDHSIGKTPTLRYQSSETSADVIFVLDADTALECPNYIERLVQELYQGIGIASACGLILPLRERDWQSMLERNPALKKFYKKHPELYYKKIKWWHRFLRSITNLYREVLYKFIQRFTYRGEMIFFGTIINPVGCAVAYRRKYIKDLFDHYNPILGSDLTTSEDIFIGFSFANEGYRNIQLNDVCARTMEPELTQLFKQISKWSSSFLQSCYYFNSLVATPFKAFKLMAKNRRDKNSLAHKEILQKRKIKEAYRQAFGPEYTQKYGRPIGWYIFLSLVEKITFPVIIFLFLIFQWWEAFIVTFIAETLLSSLILAALFPKERIANFFKSLLISPLRYTLLLYDLYIICRLILDLWFTKNRKWTK